MMRRALLRCIARKKSRNNKRNEKNKNESIFLAKNCTFFPFSSLFFIFPVLRKRKSQRKSGEPSIIDNFRAIDRNRLGQMGKKVEKYLFSPQPTRRRNRWPALASLGYVSLSLKRLFRTENAVSLARFFVEKPFPPPSIDQYTDSASGEKSSPTLYCIYTDASFSSIPGYRISFSHR